jgi:hypothetical protein
MSLPPCRSNMVDRRGEERIMVAAQRPSTHPPNAHSQRQAAGGSDAGIALIAVIAVFAVLGVLAGDAIGARAAGALVGGFVGVVAGFAGIYVRYRDL